MPVSIGLRRSPVVTFKRYASTLLVGASANRIASVMTPAADCVDVN